MAIGEIIGAAIGVMLLVLVAYLLIGNTLVAAETVANAQKDLTLLNEARLRTSISLNKSEMSISLTPPPYILYFNITNTGNEVISDFDHMDIYTFNGTAGYQSYTYDRYWTITPGNWSITRIENDITHPGQLDPGEKLWAWAVYTGVDPIWLKVTTGNGVSAQTTYP